MMECIRIILSGWTASFRYPALISGFQPTLPIPPLSTIYGLLSAAKGESVKPQDVDIGYVFINEAKSIDVETIYELDKNLKAKSNVIKREILYQPKLYLYIRDLSVGNFFKRPKYQLLLGRSSDLCMVEEISKVKLEKVKRDIQVGNTILPFPMEGISGVVQALPTHFTEDIPRKAQGTKIFCIVNGMHSYSGSEFLYDNDFDWGVYIHGMEE